MAQEELTSHQLSAGWRRGPTYSLCISEISYFSPIQVLTKAWPCLTSEIRWNQAPSRCTLSGVAFLNGLKVVRRSRPNCPGPVWVGQEWEEDHFLPFCFPGFCDSCCESFSWLLLLRKEGTICVGWWKEGPVRLVCLGLPRLPPPEAGRLKLLLAGLCQISFSSQITCSQQAGSSPPRRLGGASCCGSHSGGGRY
jgi:hypothetical protein